jgi:hypothetical protein
MLQLAHSWGLPIEASVLKAAACAGHVSIVKYLIEINVSGDTRDVCWLAAHIGGKEQTYRVHCHWQ